MERAFLGLSHTPLMGLNPVASAVEQELRAAIATAREQVRAFAPALVATASSTSRCRRFAWDRALPP
jgi:hypothetical protein